MQNIKKIFFYFVFIFSTQACYCSEPLIEGMGVKAVKAAGVAVNGIVKDNLPKAGEIVTDASAKIGVEAAAKFAPAATIFAGAYAASQVYYMGKDISEGLAVRYWPTDAQKAEALKAKKEYEILSSERALKSCLVQNAQSARGATGLPSICQSTANTFAMVAGNKPLKNITKTFTTVFGEY